MQGMRGRVGRERLTGFTKHYHLILEKIVASANTKRRTLFFRTIATPCLFVDGLRHVIIEIIILLFACSLPCFGFLLVHSLPSTKEPNSCVLARNSLSLSPALCLPFLSSRLRLRRTDAALDFSTAPPLPEEDVFWSGLEKRNRSRP